MTSPKEHHKQFTDILKELHEVSQRLHLIAEEVCLQKEVVETIVNGLVGIDAHRSKSEGDILHSVEQDISDAEERRDNDSGHTNAEDADNERWTNEGGPT